MQLFELALEIDEGQIFELGMRLGFGASQLKRFLYTNRIDGQRRGAQDMLFDWSRKTPTDVQGIRLKNALIESGLSHLTELLDTGSYKDADEGKIFIPQ